jgi:hypothetical protein
MAETERAKARNALGSAAKPDLAAMNLTPVIIKPMDL